MTNKIIEKFVAYNIDVRRAWDTIDKKQVESVYHLLNVIRSKTRIFVCGNGGSAAVAEHFSCDHSKGVRKDTNLRPEVISLSSNMALLTAIANDYGYEYTFINQLKYHNLHSKDVVVAISSSGKSPNVVHAIKYARKIKTYTISMVGFDGGELKKIYDAEPSFYHALLHVKAENYGVVEDCHQMLMHMLAQSLRENNLIQ